MVALKHFKVAALPAVLEPNAIYYVDQGGTVAEYVTSVNGVAKRVEGSASGGGAAPTLTVPAGVAINQGQPVIVTNGSKLALASAANFNTAAVLGFASETVSANFPCDVERTQITLADWTGIADGAGLVPGARYFLGVTPGTITSIPPTTVGQCLCVVGEAISASTLAVSLSDPIQL